MRGEKARRTILVVTVWLMAVAPVLGLAPRAAAQGAGVFGAVETDLSEITNLADLLTAAIANSRDVRAAEYQLEAARAGLKQVEAGLNPQLQATASYSVANYTESLFEAVDGTVRKASGALTWAQQLGPNSALRTGIDKANIAVEQAEIQRQQAVISVITSVQSAYYSVINAQRGVALAEEALANARRKAEITARQVADGMATSVDLLTAENALLEAQNGVSAAKSGLDVALLALLQTMGLSHGNLAEARDWAERLVAAQDFDPNKWDVDLTEAIECAKEHRLDLALVERQVSMAKLDVDAVAKQRDWKVSLNGMTVKNDLVFNSSVDTERLFMATVAKTKSEGTKPSHLAEAISQLSAPQLGDQKRQEDPWQVTAELSYRFGDGGAREAQLEQAQAVYNSVQLQYEKLLDGVCLDVFSARENMLQAWRVYEQSIQVLAQAKAVYQQLEKAHALGSIPEFDLLEGSLLVAQAENRVIAAALSYESSKTRFAASLGVPIDTLISAVGSNRWPVISD